MKLGIIGGGQLAKMTAQAAAQLGCEVVLLEKEREFPARSIAARSIIKDINDPQALLELASSVDVTTLENEFVSPAGLKQVEAAGHVLYPSAATMALVQDKFRQKTTLREVGIVTADSRSVSTVEELKSIGREVGFPLVLKARFNAYDGKGNATVRNAEEADVAWAKLGGDRGNALYVEAFCDFACELATIVTRGRDGRTACYPVVQTVQRNHVCHSVYAPAEVAGNVAERAREQACRAIEAIGGVGSFGVELFLSRSREVLVNELAPRVHNSGHYTIEACECSQFENHVRAVLGLPLGSPKMSVNAAVMVNLLSTGEGEGTPRGLKEALSVAAAHIHIYGKRKSRPGRKMGHVTAVGADLATARRTAETAAQCIRFGD